MSSGSLQDRKKWKGQQLDYNAFILNASSHYCLYCLSDTQAEALNSLLEIYQYKTRWISPTSEPIDQLLTSEWYEGISSVLMNPCCNDDAPRIYRWTVNEYGTTVYQSSDDGGATWNDSPNLDYRNTSTENPNPNDLGFDIGTCQAANGVSEYFKTEINEQVVEDMTAAQILAVVAAALLIWLSAGTSAALSAQLVALFAAILGAGVSAWQAAFTDEVWDTLECILETYMQPDLSFTPADIDSINNAIGEQLTGIVVPTLQGYVNASGAVGLTNIARSGEGDPDANCCPTCEDDFDIWNGDTETFGEIVTRGDGFIICNLLFCPTEVGEYFLRMKTSATTSCCKVTHYDILSGGTINISVYTLCGDAFGTNGHTLNTDFGSGDNLVNTITIGSTGACQVKFYFE